MGIERNSVEYKIPCEGHKDIILLMKAIATRTTAISATFSPTDAEDLLKIHSILRQMQGDRYNPHPVPDDMVNAIVEMATLTKVMIFSTLVYDYNYSSAATPQTKAGIILSTPALEQAYARLSNPILIGNGWRFRAIIMNEAQGRGAEMVKKAIIEMNPEQYELWTANIELNPHMVGKEYYDTVEYSASLFITPTEITLRTPELPHKPESIEDLITI